MSYFIASTFSFIVLMAAAGWIYVVNCANIGSGIFTEDEDDVCACTLEYQPFCGSDQNTYSNMCDLACSMKNNPGLHAVCSGPCPCTSPTDVHEYSSEDFYRRNLVDFFSFQGGSETKRSFVEKNEAENQLDACTCPRIFDPVCGSNNVTYANECLLICHQQLNNNTDLIQVGNGKCPK